MWAVFASYGPESLRVVLYAWVGLMIIDLVLLTGIENCYAEGTHHSVARSAGKNK
jgi:hypothetical protein